MPRQRKELRRYFVMMVQAKINLMDVMRRGSEEGAAVTGRAPQYDPATATSNDARDVPLSAFSLTRSK